MLHALWHKIKESAVSVIPVAVIVLVLSFTPLVNLSLTETICFSVCALFLILGMALFNLGADMAMTPMGEQIGSGLPKKGKFKTLLLVCFIMGVCVTIAEPDLSVLASQTKEVFHSPTLIATVGVGVGMFSLLAVLKIVFRLSLAHMMTFFYLLLFALACLLLENGKSFFLPLAFDSGGVTTGPITVPFIMALGLGVSTALGDKRDKENSFGVVALCSIGPILAVLLLGLISNGTMDYKLPDYTLHAGVGAILTTTWHTAQEVLIALLPIVAFFFLLQITVLKISKKRLKPIIVGIFYTFFGLAIFLTAVFVGFMPIGYKMGVQLAEAHPALFIGLSFLLGVTVVLAEPAIHVLNKQVESVTGGAISKRSMLVALSVGVGIAIALSAIRVVFDFSVLYYLIPGYFLSLGISFFVPKVYTAIAFDSGGVASGPLTSSFILPFMIGACFCLQGEASVMLDAFGLVAMVAMTPLISIQALGFKAVATNHFREKIAMRRILSADDEQIIQFL